MGDDEEDFLLGALAGAAVFCTGAAFLTGVPGAFTFFAGVLFAELFAGFFEAMRSLCYKK